MASGACAAAILWDVNPAYAFAPGAAWKDAFAKVPFRAWVGLIEDESSAQCELVLPESHWLESWGDFGFGSPVTLQQPTIGTLYDTRQGEDILLAGIEGPRWAGGERLSRVPEGPVAHGLSEGAPRWAGDPHPRTTVFPTRFHRRVGRARGIAGSRPHGRRDGTRPVPRLRHLRWPLRQQRLAPGMSRSGHQGDVGQPGDDLGGRRPHARRRGRRVRHHRHRAREPARPGGHPAGPGRRRAGPGARLWA